MTTRQFDPVLSAALRNELEALADAPEPTPAKGFLPTLRKPQVWISIVTAVVLVAATVGVLQVTHGGDESDPAGRSRVVDPLAQITHPSDANYVARLVHTLLTVRGTGPGTHDFEVPAGTNSVRTYVDCAPSRKFATEIDGLGESSGECDRTLTSSYDMPIPAGRHTLTVTVPKGTEYSVLVMVSPPPTVSTGALIDPVAQVQDLRNPDALTGDTTPLLRQSGTGDMPAVALRVPAGADRLRAYFVCEPSSVTRTALIDGHVVSGCMNSIAHWFDFTPSGRSVTAEVGEAGITAPSAGSWSLLVVRAPKGAKDSPSSGTLPYPGTSGAVLARTRGIGSPASGTYRNPGKSILLSVTCIGTGWLEMSTSDGGTNTRGNACSTTAPITVGFIGDKDDSLKKWTAIPHGDISWTFQISNDD